MNKCEIYQIFDSQIIYSHVNQCIDENIIIGVSELCITRNPSDQPTNTPITHTIIIPPSMNPTFEPTNSASTIPTTTKLFLPNFHVQEVASTTENIIEITAAPTKNPGHVSNEEDENESPSKSACYSTRHVMIALIVLLLCQHFIRMY